LSFVNDNTGYAALGSGLVSKTTNAGVNWVDLVTGNPNYILAVHFVNPSTGFISSNNNNIYGTTNGGTNWIPVNPPAAAITSFATINTSHVIGTGYSGMVILSTNSGSSWQVLQQGYSNRVSDIQFINLQTGWAANNADQLLYTSNGGANWLPSISSGLVSAERLYFLNASTGFTAGISGSLMSGASTASVAKTTNGGLNWITTQLPDNGSAFELQFVNANDGFLLIRTNTLAYKLYRTTNTGTNWNLTYTTSELMNDIYFTTQLNGWMAGESGKVYKTTNGGTNWNLQTTGITEQLLGVFFQNANFGWACGFNGKIIATTNGGTSWSQQVSGTTKALTD
ncbi:MAG TPA: YCF48-related protein, partial [Ignavibacteria bacterium]|nr:YCF48-related protein [Ignavibacteria bacterium]